MKTGRANPAPTKNQKPPSVINPLKLRGFVMASVAWQSSADNGFLKRTAHNLEFWIASSMTPRNDGREKVSFPDLVILSECEGS
jgi:hypothetical protein